MYPAGRVGDAHHLIHWADGGPTDLTNAALLCRLHTIVHARRYAGQVATGPPGTPTRTACAWCGTSPSAATTSTWRATAPTAGAG